MENIVNWLNGWNQGGKLSLLWFVPITALLVWAAIKIVKHAEVIIAKTKFGGAFIGGVLIATITSIPELLTGIAQATSNDPAAGNADNLGSNAFSGFLIAIAAILFIRETFLKRLGKWTIISLWISFALAASAFIMMEVQDDVILGTTGKFAIGLFPVALFAFYALSLWLQYRFGDEDEVDHDNEFVKQTSAKKSLIWFILWSFVLIALALIDNWLASSIQDGYSLDSTTIGGVFLSIATSLPEVVAFFVLLKKKQTSAAVAALIGSHIFNMSIDFFIDISYPKEAIYTLGAMHDNWRLALLTTSMMFALALFATISPKFKIFDNKIVYAIVPSMVAIGYIVGWALMLA